jgi:adenylyltransferase/sulfurtransferase
MREVSVEQLKEELKRGEIYLLDVRNPDEYAFCNLGGVNIPLGLLHDEYTQVPVDKKVYCLCHHGVRSKVAQDFLCSKGYSDVLNITGGIDAWSLRVDESVKRY